MTESFRLGVTLHSFANEYTTYQWSLEDLFRLTAGLGGGLEIVGPSHQRGFPHVTDEYETILKSAVDRYGLTRTSYGSYADPFMLPDRDLNADELVEYTTVQLHSAKRLGFPIVRLQHFTAEVIDRILPVAELLNIVVAWELHVPMTISSARTQYLLELIDRYKSPHLGLIPDAGIFARSVSQWHKDQGSALGVSAEGINTVVRAWDQGLELPDALVVAGSPDPKSPVATWIGGIWDTFGHSDPSELVDIMPWVVHFHGKFFHIENGQEPDLRYDEIVSTLVDVGYTGWISSEYEGTAPDSYRLVAEHQNMLLRLRESSLK